MPVSARSLVLDLLATLRRGSMPVRALVEAGGLLGLEENNVRVAVARLYASGRIERDERGRYRLGPAAAAIGGRLRSWRELDRRLDAWSGRWAALHRTRPGRGRDRRRRERSLGWLGFREWRSGLFVRPDNLHGGVPRLREELKRLAGEAGGAPDDGGCVFAIDEPSPADANALRELWDTDALGREAQESSARLRESEGRLAELDEAGAMVESFVVGGAVLRQLQRHPLLPPEILDPEPLTTLLADMRRYDERGRAAWAPFLARHDVPHRAWPLDSRRPEFERVVSLQ